MKRMKRSRVVLNREREKGEIQLHPGQPGILNRGKRLIGKNCLPQGKAISVGLKSRKITLITLFALAWGRKKIV